jgi:hypothetical protein
LYTTPRTLPPGTVQWQVAPEVIGVSYDITAATPAGTTTTTVTDVVPMVPSFGARIGVTDGFDIGLRLSNFDSIGADAKILAVKGAFDLAFDPGLQGYYVDIAGVGVGVVYLHAPLLLGVNVSPNVSLVFTPGVVLEAASVSVNNGSGVTGAASATGVLARLGAGIDVRITPRFAIHPEFTAMRSFGDTNGLIFVGGFGFNIGAQPDYSDLGAPAPSK